MIASQELKVYHARALSFRIPRVYIFTSDERKGRSLTRNARGTDLGVSKSRNCYERGRDRLMLVRPTVDTTDGTRTLRSNFTFLLVFLSNERKFRVKKKKKKRKKKLYSGTRCPACECN